MTQSGSKAKRNTSQLTFGRAVDMLSAIEADEERERTEALKAVEVRQVQRRERILSRCDAATRERVTNFLFPKEDR